MEVREARAGYLAKPAFKQTEVGEIPEDWAVVCAEEACIKIQDGTHFSPRPGGTDNMYVTSKNIRFGFLDLSTVETIDAEQHAEIYRRCDTRHGDLLLTKDGASTGNAALNTVAEEISLLSSVAFLRFDEQKHAAPYFLQQVLAHGGQKRIQEAMSGNAITRLTLEKIRALKYPVPPTLAEQQAIADALDDADALIDSLEQLLAKKRQIKQGSLQALLTGQQRLPGFEGAWEIRQIGDIAPLQRGFDLPNSSIEAGPYPVVFSNGILKTHNECQVKGPGVVTGRSGTLGTVTYIEEDFWPHNTSLWVTTFNGNDPKFIFYLYAYVDFARFGSGSGVPTLNRNDAHSHLINVPVDTIEQTAIATVLADMDAEIAALAARLAKTRALKQGMMQALLTGRIRLV